MNAKKIACFWCKKNAFFPPSEVKHLIKAERVQQVLFCSQEPLPLFLLSRPFKWDRSVWANPIFFQRGFRGFSAREIRSLLDFAVFLLITEYSGPVWLVYLVSVFAAQSSSTATWAPTFSEIRAPGTLLGNYTSQQPPRSSQEGRLRTKILSSKFGAFSCQPWPIM